MNSTSSPDRCAKCRASVHRFAGSAGGWACPRCGREVVVAPDFGAWISCSPEGPVTGGAVARGADGLTVLTPSTAGSWRWIGALVVGGIALGVTLIWTLPASALARAGMTATWVGSFGLVLAFLHQAAQDARLVFDRERRSLCLEKKGTVVLEVPFAAVETVYLRIQPTAEDQNHDVRVRIQGGELRVYHPQGLEPGQRWMERLRSLTGLPLDAAPRYVDPE